MAKTQDFINAVNPIAQEVYKNTGILPSVTIAQALLETGGKLNNSLAKVFNFFGEKAGSSWTGKTVTYTTSEYGSGGYYNTKARFKAYDSIEQAAAGRSKLLNYDRYKPAQKATTFEGQAIAIKAGGYATDPKYVSKLKSKYNEYNLGQYDNGKKKDVNVTPFVGDNIEITGETTQNNVQVQQAGFNPLVPGYGLFGSGFTFKYARIVVYIILSIIMVIALFLAIGVNPKSIILQTIPTPTETPDIKPKPEMMLND